MIRPRYWSLLICLVAIYATVACTRPAPRPRAEGGGVVGRIWPSELSIPATLPTEPGESFTPAPSGSSESVDTVFTLAAVASPSPAYPGAYAGSPTPDPTPIPHYSGRGVESYTVRSGEALSLIAPLFDCSVEEIVAANGLPNADSIHAGQTLIIPVVTAQTSRTLKLIPDSEFVYGPAYIHFDLADFVAKQSGYLADYTEKVEGRTLTGVEIIQLVAHRFGLGPRMLLTLLELQSGWVSQSHPTSGTLYYPLGHVQTHREGLFQQLNWVSLRLNEAYYGWKRGDHTTVRLTDGNRYAISPEVNPGTASVQTCLAELSTSRDEWFDLTGASGFLATYERLFGNPFAYTVDPLVPPNLVQPELRLPWEFGHTWYFTGGPHGGWGEGSGLAALDFVPEDEYLGCQPSSEWVTAAAAGRVIRSEDGEVVLDLDGDGFEQSGWTLLYLHVHEEGRVEVDTFVQRGQRIGHPSCEGGYSDATHLHFSRRYNGEWIPAGSGPIPMVLSGWTAHDGTAPYEGSMTRGDEQRVSCECWEDDYNGLTSDNAP